ncbi:MAG: fumarylacetoacetate hydrolase family protein [Firmicutes bacterium]|nr:fumarylacetoacetate hydrolase family protein [Bacillota bacterium]
MRIVAFERHQVGVVEGDAVYDLTPWLAPQGRHTPHAVQYLIADFENIRARYQRERDQLERYPLASIRLLPPVPAPGQILGAPTNYREHGQEMQGTVMSDANRRGTPETLGLFWKSPTSVAGPHDAVELPDLPGRRFDHEAELGVVIGREARSVDPSQALSYVFGYTCLMDLTLRMDETHKEERSWRKSYHSFTPIGPWIVTADEVPDPQVLTIQLWVNGELRQKASTAAMIVPVARLIALSSSVMPLKPGDLIATGTPAGVGPIAVGDRIRIAIEGIGEMELPVRRREW